MDFLLADAEAVSFPEHSFDLILCSNGMAYLQDIPAAVKKFHSWLKPGGKLCFNNPQVPCKYRADNLCSMPAQAWALMHICISQ